jgi:WD40 repeat protein
VAKNQNISIYSVYTGEFLSGFNLRAHSSTIPFIAWHPNDMGLFSIGKDGQLNEWHLENSHQRYPIMDESNLGEHFDFIVNDNGECDVFASSTETYIYHAKNERLESNGFKDKDLALEGKSYQTPPIEIIPAGN